MAKWFYLTDGQERGPVEPAALKHLAATGHLKSTDKVRREDMSEWHQARQVKGLFPDTEIRSAASTTKNTTGVLNSEPTSSREAPMQGSRAQDDGSLSPPRQNLHKPATFLAATCGVLLVVIVALVWMLVGRSRSSEAASKPSVAKNSEANLKNNQQQASREAVQAKVSEIPEDTASKSAVSSGSPTLSAPNIKAGVTGIPVKAPKEAASSNSPQGYTETVSDLIKLSDQYLKSGKLHLNFVEAAHLRKYLYDAQEIAINLDEMDAKRHKLIERAKSGTLDGDAARRKYLDTVADYEKAHDELYKEMKEKLDMAIKLGKLGEK